MSRRTLYMLACGGATLLLANTLLNVRESFAEEFVTPQQAFRDASTTQPLPDKAVPYCSSKLGCWLSGVHLAEPGTAAAPVLPDATGGHDAAAAGDRHTSRRRAAARTTMSRHVAQAAKDSLVIAASTADADRLRALVRKVPKANVRFVTASGDAERRDADLALRPKLGRSDEAHSVDVFADRMVVVAGAQIRALRDLDGKVVSFGPQDAAETARVRKMFAELGVKVHETPLDLDNALDGLATRDVAAAVVVAPTEARPLAQLANPSLHLIAWPDDALPAGAALAPYAGLGQVGSDVKAVELTSTLVPTAKGADRPATKLFLASLAKALEKSPTAATEVRTGRAVATPATIAARQAAAHP